MLTKIYYLLIFSLLLCSCNIGRSAQESTTQLASHSNPTQHIAVRFVSDWGASPENSPKQNSIALNNALTWLSEHPNSTLSFAPHAIYKVDAQLKLDLKYNASIIGNGATIDGTDFKGSSLVNIQGSKTYIANLAFDVDKSASQIPIVSKAQGEQLNPGDSLLILQDKLLIPDYTLQLDDSLTYPLKPNSIVKLHIVAADAKYLSDKMLGQSIVLGEASSADRLSTDGATIHIVARNESESYLVGVVGNNNSINSSLIPSGKWGLTRLWNPARSYYIKGEFATLKQSDGKVLTLDEKLYDSYSKRDTSIYKITRAKLSISNLSVKANTSSGDDGLNIQNLAQVKLNQVNILQARYRGIVLTNIGQLDIIDSSVNGLPSCANCTSYGLAIMSSQNVTLHGGSYDTGNHAITFGGTSPNRNIKLIDVVVNSNTNTYALDFHGNSELVHLSNVSSSAGFGYSGVDLIVESSFFSNKKSGSAVMGMFISPERSGGSFIIKDTQISSDAGNALTLSNAFIQRPEHTELALKYPFAYVNDIIIKNSYIKSSTKLGTNRHALYMQPHNLSAMPMVFKRLSISDSELFSEYGFALALGSNGIALQVESTEVNHSTLTSLNNSAMYLKPQTNRTNMTSNLLIQNSKISSGKFAIGSIIYYYATLKLKNNTFYGNGGLQKLSILHFYQAEISNNSFYDWYTQHGLLLSQTDLEAALFGTSMINSHSESATIGINNNTIG